MKSRFHVFFTPENDFTHICAITRKTYYKQIITMKSKNIFLAVAFFGVLMACLPSYAQVSDKVGITASNDRMEKATTPRESQIGQESKIVATATVTAPTFESSRSQALMRALGSAMAYTYDVGTIEPNDEFGSQESYTIKVSINTDKRGKGFETTVQVQAEQVETNVIYHKR